MYEIKYLYDRLKEKYPRYQLDFYGERFTLILLYGSVEVNREGCQLFANEKLYDELPGEEVDDIDDHYEFIEAFLLQMKHYGMEHGNALRNAGVAVRWRSFNGLHGSLAADKESALSDSVFSVSGSRISVLSPDGAEGFSSISDMSGMRSGVAT